MNVHIVLMVGDYVIYWQVMEATVLDELLWVCLMHW